jgi:mRNA interferase RelE/StbE
VAYSLELAKRARKQLDLLPPDDRARILAALHQMADDPYSGDIKRLKGHRFGWRRRVGDYRILYDLDSVRSVIIVAMVERRTTTTYRRR